MNPDPVTDPDMDEDPDPDLGSYPDPDTDEDPDPDSGSYPDPGMDPNTDVGFLRGDILIEGGRDCFTGLRTAGVPVELK
eukprot:CAMPEP_0119054378 /NCGR_PEP_ID=MMETSP1177-20130426/75028_1 /TAXON_ID=2985 /ORGANISM="Ochromonas sp, Strain CCMP1899" /LENGTH=78 /DNA_ID=CAMNT_0007034589 /DNA_START=654 /DNA_END=890 /DNA_ORIENTATION=+